MQDYDLYIIIVAAMAFITGLLLISSPKTLIKAGELFNRVYNVESTIYTKRIPFGFAYMIFGGVLLYILW